MESPIQKARSHDTTPKRRGEERGSIEEVGRVRPVQDANIVYYRKARRVLLPVDLDGWGSLQLRKPRCRVA